MAITPPPVITWTSPNWGGCPPDTQIAVSGEKRGKAAAYNQFVVLSTNSSITIYKKDGSLVSTQSYATFFSSLIINDGNPYNANNVTVQSDPRVLFDPYRRRFWVVHGAGNGPFMKKDGSNWSQVRGRLFVAVSKTEDPTAGWWYYMWDAVGDWGGKAGFGQPGDIADYPCIGIGPSAFLVCIGVVNQPAINASRTQRYTYAIVADAASLANGVDKGNWWTWNVFTDPNGNIYKGVESAADFAAGNRRGAIQPAMHYGPTDSVYYAAANDVKSVLVWQLRKPLGTGSEPQLSSVVVPIDGGATVYGGVLLSPVEAAQKGSNELIAMTNVGNDVLAAVYRGNRLYFVCHDARDWFATNSPATAIRLVRLDMSNYPSIPDPSNPGGINRRFGRNSQTPPADDPKAIVHYGWPSLAVNKNGDMLMAYTRSGTSVYPQARLSAYYAAESDIRGSNLLKVGEGPYSAPIPGTTNRCIYKLGPPVILRWGDTSGACVDPVDDTTFWVANQYAVASGGYGIALGKVVL